MLGTDVQEKWYRLRWAGSRSPLPITSTAILQNSARLRVAEGRKEPPPVPTTTPSRRRISAASAVSASLMSWNAEPSAAPHGQDQQSLQRVAAARAPARIRLQFMHFSPLHLGSIRTQCFHRLEAAGP